MACSCAALGAGAGLALLTPPPSRAPSNHVAIADSGPAALASLPAGTRATPVATQSEPLRTEAFDLPAPAAQSAALSLGEAFKQGRVITGTTAHRFVLFTFDDGPDPRTTPLLLDRLDDAGIKAIFFLVASRMADETPLQREQALLAREIVRRGHMVGGHTVDHVQLPLLPDDEVRAQLAGAETILERELGARPYIYRPPFGAHSQRVDQLAGMRGYTPVLWNLGGDDVHVHTAQEVYESVVRDLRLKKGGIVLLHDIHPWSVDAFQMIVAYLRTRNCELLDQGEELYDIVDDLHFFYVPREGAPADAEPLAVEPDPAELRQRQAALADRTARRCKSMARND